MHPYGTGSAFAEPLSGQPHRQVRNRATAIQSWCRRSNGLWAFWQLDQYIKRELFTGNIRRRQFGRPASSLTETDPFTRAYGTVIPADLPETTAWWRKQQKQLSAITEDGEHGLMQAMITITHNSRVAEMLASVRRGPFGIPTREEQIEYLLTRHSKKEKRVSFTDHALEHVLSYQRRVHAIKEHFLKRDKITPLGIVLDYWDRFPSLF